MTTATDEFIQTLSGNLTPEDVARLLESGDGDTTATAAEKGNEPDITTATGTEGQQAAPVAGEGGEPDPANTVLLAKDGIHTIGYEKLVEAREDGKRWKAQAEASQLQLQTQAQQLQTLQAEAKARADAGLAPTVTDNQAAVAQAAIEQGADASLFGDFSEEALAKGIEKLVAAQVAAKVDEHVSKALKPIQEKQAVDSTEAHYGAIYTAHPDADSIVESKELADWIDKQPSFVRGAFSSVLEKGTTEQVIEMLDQFKLANGKTTAATTETSAESVKAAAKAALAKANTPIPVSLSDFPSGRAGSGATREEAMADMQGNELVDAMHDWSPEQIETYLSRRV